MEYRKLMKNPKYRPLCRNSYAKEIGQTAQVMPGLVECTNTIFFVDKTAVPADRWRDVAYGEIVVDCRPEKTNPYRTILTVGGYRVNYPGYCGTPTVDLTTLKLLLDSIVSILNAKFMTIDVKGFYLNNPVAQSKYMRLKISDLPKSVVQHYNMAEKATRNGYVYVGIKRGMYGLPQSGIIVQQLLDKRLNRKGYHKSEITLGLRKHKWRPICFPLFFDYFGVKYVGKHHAEHLISVLREHYKISHYWKVKIYLGLYLDWKYGHLKVHLSMLSYVTDALTRFLHDKPRKPQHQPYPHIKPNYGAKAQYAEAADVSPPLSIADKKNVQ